MEKRRKSRNGYHRKNVYLTYSNFYLLTFCMAILTYFIRRYVIDEDYLVWTTCSIGMCMIAYIWNIARKGWSLARIAAGVAAALFMMSMPSKLYLIESITDFAILPFLFLSVSADRKQEDFSEKVFYFKAFGIILVLILYHLHVIPDVTLYRPSKDLVRHSYGFMHTNSLSMAMISLFYDFSLMRKKIRKKLEVISIVLLILLIFAITDSRLGLMMAITTLIASIFKEKLLSIKLSGKIVYLLSLIIFVLGIVLSATYQSNNSFYEFLNTCFSGRLYNAHEYLKEYGVSWLPREIHMLTNSEGVRLYNDNFYVSSILKQGILIYALFPIVIACQMISKRFTLYHSILIFATFLSAMIETYGASICVCTILCISYFGEVVEQNDEMQLSRRASKLSVFFD